MDGIEIRRGGVEDLDAIMRHLRAGFASFAEFAPPGWEPPEPRPQRTAELLAQPGTWAAIAETRDASVGHVSFTPARGEPMEQPPEVWRREPPIRGKAHLWQLFVMPEHWGSGVAGWLHDAGTGAMVDQGYERARLYTPAAHRRARRFYQRRGWRFTHEIRDTEMGLTLAEYETELSRPGPPGPRQP